MGAAKDDLSLDHIRTLFYLEEPSGILHWKNGSGSGRPYGRKVGTLRKGYLTVIIDGKEYPVHRIVWLMRTGRWPDGDIDHRKSRDNNGNGAIREATRAQNIHASHTPVRSRTGFRGVTFNEQRGKFYAWCRTSGKTGYIGTFATAEAAARAYDARALETYGEFARLNFPNRPE